VKLAIAALEVTVAWETDIPGISRIPIGRKSMEWGPEI
jgi:hypothetical protein